MNSSTWTTPLLGTPWKSGARGPESFDCWGILCHVYETQKGVKLPTFADVLPKTGEAMELMNAKTGWNQLKEPEHLCAVALGRVSLTHHVGIYLEDDGGLILHCHETSGVIIQSPHEMRLEGWNSIKYYGLSN